MQCLQVENNLSAYIDGELNDVERKVIGEHLKSCSGCASILDELLALEPILAMPQGSQVTPELDQKLMSTLADEFQRDRLDDAANPHSQSHTRRKWAAAHARGLRGRRLVSSIIVSTSAAAVILSTLIVADTQGIINLSDNPRVRHIQEQRLLMRNRISAYNTSEDFSGFSPEDVARLEAIQRKGHEHEKKYAEDMEKGFNHFSYGRAYKSLPEKKRVLIALYESVDTTLPLEDSQGFYLTYLNPEYAHEFFVVEDLERALKAYREGKMIVISAAGGVADRRVLSIINEDGVVEYERGTK